MRVFVLRSSNPNGMYGVFTSEEKAYAQLEDLKHYYRGYKGAQFWVHGAVLNEVIGRWPGECKGVRCDKQDE
jgi:hypothetical protein